MSSPVDSKRPERFDDVDDVIETASKAADTDADALTVKQLNEVADELDLTADHIEQAIGAIDARRRAAEERSHRTRRRVIFAVAGLFGGLLVTGAFVANTMAATEARLRESMAHVEEARAQVRNVLEHRAQVEARFAGEPGLDVRARDAERRDVDHQIEIEKRRYDHAAVHYNASVQETSSWARGRELPARVPLAREITEW